VERRGAFALKGDWDSADEDFEMNALEAADEN
jgi:hypothetical protein